MDAKNEKSRPAGKPDGASLSDAIRILPRQTIESNVTLKAVASACAAVASGIGGRNQLLNREAFGVGQLVGAGLLDRGEAESRLTEAALQAGLPPGEIRATLRSGLECGIASPREIDFGPLHTPKPERPSPQKATPHGSHDPQAIWDACAPAPADHPYLTKKGIQAHGLRLYTGQLRISRQSI